jgi:uncharacterized protein
MQFEIEGFDWDKGNSEKCRRHGLAIAEIEAAFWSGPLIAPDPRHSDIEQRYIAIARNADGRPMFIAFTYRQSHGLTSVRPVSARYMHKKEGPEI